MTDIKQYIFYYNQCCGMTVRGKGKKVAVYVEVPSRRVQIEDVGSKELNHSVYNGEGFDKLLEACQDLISTMHKISFRISACKTFNSVGEYDMWRQKSTWLSDENIQCKMFAVHEDGHIDVFIAENTSIPHQMIEAYELASKIKVNI